MLKLIFVGVGGALGAVLRYELDLIIIKETQGFPWDTLFVNLLGCFIIGVAYKVFYYKLLDSRVQNFIVTGFLGALTTFSSYSYATLMLFEQGQVYTALANLLLNNTLGIFFAFIGSFVTTKFIVKHLNL